MLRPILGVQKVLFIRVKYPDDAQVVLTAQQAQAHADNLKAIFKANSYDKLNLEIDITPVLTMPQPTSFYHLFNRLSFVRIRADAIKIAEEAGYHESDYDREVIFTTKVWPLVQTGVGGINLRTSYITKNSPSLTAHEMGHTFDWSHANFWRVTSASPIDTAGEQIEYGDKFDIMGDVFHFHHFNPWYKFRVGWIPPENILTVSDSGTYFIRALEEPPQAGAPGNTYSALRIRRDRNTEYWVYYRSREDSANTGALISRMEPQNRSQTLLLDMTPGSRPKNKDHKDAALVPGNTIRDQEAGIEITVLGKNSDSLGVRVVVSNDAIDTLPIIDILNPKPGITVHGAIDYEATAFDPDAGTMNGAGIDTVTFVLNYSEVKETLLDQTVKIVAVTQLTTPPYIFHVETDGLADEAYRLTVLAKSQNGGVNRAQINHIIDNTGPSVPTSIDEKRVAAASTFQLQQNYPNPFNPSTMINYTVGHGGQVELRIYDLLGRKVRSLVHENKPAGEYSVLWNGTNDAGRRVATGSYFYEIRVGEFISIKRMLLLK
ncbi:MAG: FlgD immunoglobulin-like domain containing protein [bacterium]